MVFKVERRMNRKQERKDRNVKRFKRDHPRAKRVRLDFEISVQIVGVMIWMGCCALLLMLCFAKDE